MNLTELVSLGMAGAPSEVGRSATQMDVIILIGAILLALGLSFLCSIAEAVLLSITPSYIESQREKRPRRAARLTKLKLDNVDRSLAAILTLNTIAHTVGAILSGAKATVVFGSAWFGLFSAIMTLMILFFSEIIPKTLGALYWKHLVGPTAFFVDALIFVLYPFVWLSECLTRLIARNRKAPLVSREELISMARVGEQGGHILVRESRILTNLFRLSSLKAEDIMTPRTVVAALPETMTLEAALPEVSKRPFSRLPVYSDSMDEVTGFVLRDDVLMRNTQEHAGETLASIRRDLLSVLDSLSLSELLERFLKERHQFAIVLDEYGGTKGLVTLEDLVETLIGMEIVDETDHVVDMRALARKQWEKRVKAMGREADEAEPLK